jgi:hypothetical protein
MDFSQIILISMCFTHYIPKTKNLNYDLIKCACCELQKVRKYIRIPSMILTLWNNNLH